MATALLDGFEYKDRYHIMAHAAYITRQTLYNEVEDKYEYCHANKSDLIFKKVLTPDGTPQEYNNPEKLMNEVLRTGYDRCGKSFYVGMPVEASLEQQIEIVEYFSKDTFVNDGYIVLYAVHDEKVDKNTGLGNDNVHSHLTALDMKCVMNEETQQMELCKKGSETSKSDYCYVDINGNRIDPVPQPRLKNGKLRYDKNGNIMYQKRTGYKELQFDENGKPKLNEDGTPIFVDRRVKTSIGEDGRQNYSKKNFPKCKYDEKGGIKLLRQKWEYWHNYVVRKYHIKDKNGRLALIDMRSYAEQDKNKPDELKRIPQKKCYKSDLKKETEPKKQNDKYAKYNNNILELKRLEEEKDRLNFEIMGDMREIDNDISHVNSINAEQRWAETWVRAAMYAKKQNTRMLQKFEAQLKETISKGSDSLIKETDELERERIKLHQQIMKEEIKDIEEAKRVEYERLEKLAIDNFNNMTDVERTAWIRDRISEDAALIYARTIARKTKNYEAYNGLDESQRAKDNPTTATYDDINKLHNELSFDKWNKSNYEAPPKELLQKINTIFNIEHVFGAKLGDKTPMNNHIGKNLKFSAEDVERTISVQKEKRYTRMLTEELARQQRKAELRRQQYEAELRIQLKEAKRQAEELAKQQREAELRRQQEEAAKRQAEEQARQQREAEIRRQQEEAKRQAEEQARQQREAEIRRQQEEAKRQAEEQARKEQERQAELLKKQQEEAAKRDAEIRRQQREAELLRQQQEEAKRQAEKQARQEEARQAELQRKQQEEAAKREEEVRRKQEEARLERKEPLRNTDDAWNALRQKGQYVQITDNSIPTQFLQPTQQPKVDEYEERIAKFYKEQEEYKNSEEYKKDIIKDSIDEIKDKYLLAYAAKDSKTIEELRIIVNYAYTPEELEWEYNRTKFVRQTEQDKMIDDYLLKKYNIDPIFDARKKEKALEELSDKKGKINARKMNKVIKEYNDSVNDERLMVATATYRNASDEANFWYNMKNKQNPTGGTTKALTNGNQQKQTQKEPEVEIQYPEPKRRGRSGSSRQADTNEYRNGSHGTSSNAATPKVKVKWNEKDYHEKSAMEEAEDRTYKGWDPGTSNFVR